MTRWKDRIVCYSLAEWQKLIDRIDELERGNPDSMSKTFRRFFVGPAEGVSIDATGRVELPPMLRALANLEEEAELVAVWTGRVLELWSPDAYHRPAEDQSLSSERLRG